MLLFTTGVTFADILVNCLRVKVECDAVVCQGQLLSGWPADDTCLPQLCVQWPHVGTLKLVTVEVFTLEKLGNTSRL